MTTAPLQRLALNQVMVPHTTFEQDVTACVHAGYGGLSIIGSKIPHGRERELATLMSQSGLEVALAGGDIAGVLYDDHFKGPTDPPERVAAICDGIARLAPFEPKMLLAITGSPDPALKKAGRCAVVEGMRTIAQVAAQYGMSIALEPLANAAEMSLVHTPEAAVKLVDEIAAPNVGILIDISNVSIWTGQQLRTDIDRFADRIFAVQIADWRAAPRGPMDRALPGEGIADFPSILGQLEANGYSGWYDLEVFSDDGVWGQALEDSLLKLPQVEMLLRARHAFESVWPPNPKDRL